MAAVQARTPPLLQRTQPTSTRPTRSRSARTNQHDSLLNIPPPPPPAFQTRRPSTLSKVFNNTNSPAQQSPARTLKPSAFPLSPRPRSLNQLGKRPVQDDVVDLTCTTGDVESDQLEPHLAKRPRNAPVEPAPRPAPAVTTAADAARRTQARREKHDKMEAEAFTWRQKYKKAFPSFVFYFDHIDEATKPALTKQVERLGSTVDNFFSKKVTHVVTTRPIPGSSNKENVDSPAPPSRQSFASTLAASVMTAPLPSAAGPSRTKKPPRKSPIGYLAMDGQQLRQYGEGFEKNPFIDHQDILSKAADFGLKIWRLDKIQNMLSRIHSNSPVKGDANSRRKLSLPSLLRDEQLFGTRERDPFVPRPDMHYFPAHHRYLLVEDSTGEHRPIAVKEYEKPRKGDDPPWPVLWGGIEGRGAFYHYTGPPVVHKRLERPSKPEERALTPVAVEPLAKPGPAPFAARAVAPNLRRTASLNRLTTAAHHKGGEGMAANPAPYLAASGNSQTITSTVASATSTRGGGGAVLGGTLGNGPLVNRRLASLSRSTVPTRFGEQLSAPGKLKRSTSVDAGLNARAPPPREEPKKPGYCENCRVKYDDFKEHVVHRKHRKFARNPDNWVDLDRLLAKIDRPLLEPPSSPVGSEGDSGFYDGVCADDEDAELEDEYDESDDEDCEEVPEPSDPGEEEEEEDEDEDEVDDDEEGDEL